MPETDSLRIAHPWTETNRTNSGGRTDTQNSSTRIRTGRQARKTSPDTGSTLQTAAITTGLPFAGVILLLIYTLFTGLAHEHAVLQEIETPSTLPDGGDTESNATRSGPATTESDGD